MSLKTDDIVRQLRAVVHDHRRSSGNDEYAMRRVLSRARSAVERLAPPGSTYREDAAAILGTHDSASDYWRAEQLVAVVDALCCDDEEGHLLDVAELVHADLFDDFLDIASELANGGFNGPASVVAGSVLEEHLRKLAVKRQVAHVDAQGRPLSVERLSVELRKACVFNEAQRKTLSAWYAQRNEAAHSPAAGIDPGDVARMISGVRDFVARTPA